MAAGRVPGPEGARTGTSAIDLGTLARSPAPLPHPIGLYSGPGGAPKSTSPTKAAPKGIRVNDQSKISAQSWIDKINASGDVLDFFKHALHADGQMITVKDYRIPKDVISDDWFTDWPVAFSSNAWEITTACLEITVSLDAALDAAGNKIIGELKPDLASGESIDGLTRHLALGERGHDTKDFSVEMGSTLTDGATLNSGRKLVVVANRVTIRLGAKVVKTFTVSDAEMINTWYHEISCHAARDAEKKPSIHGDKDVERCVSDINGRMPGNGTLTAVFDQLDSLLKPAAAPAGAKH